MYWDVFFTNLAHFIYVCVISGLCTFVLIWISTILFLVVFLLILAAIGVAGGFWNGWRGLILVCYFIKVCFYRLVIIIWRGGLLFYIWSLIFCLTSELCGFCFLCAFILQTNVVGENNYNWRDLKYALGYRVFIMMMKMLSLRYWIVHCLQETDQAAILDPYI